MSVTATRSSTSICQRLMGNVNPHIPHVEGDPLTGVFLPACFAENGLNSVIDKCEAEAQKTGKGVVEGSIGLAQLLYIKDPGLSWQITEKTISGQMHDGEAGGVQRKVFGLGTVLS